jgi:excisionase family DNA binding protein
LASPAIPVSPPAPAGPNRAARRHPNGQAYVGITEAATYLGVTPKTIRKLIATNELAAYRLGTKMLRIRVADLEAVCKPL